MRRKSAPRAFTIDDFSLGWDSTNKPTTLDKRTFTDIKNFNLTRRRGLKKRGGISKLFSTSAGADTDITSLYEYKAPDGNNYVLTATGTVIRAHYNGQWNDLKTSLTTGKKYSFETHRGLCYGVNGVDSNFKLRNTTSYDVGITPPLGAPSVAVGSPANSTLYSNHGTANEDYIGEFRQNASRTQIAQSFILDENYDLTKIVLKCRKIGSPTGNMIVEIHSDQLGTQVGGDSDNVDVSTFNSTLTDKDFDFSGTAPSLTKNITYYVVIKDSGDMSGVSSTNFVEIGFDWEGGYSQGAYFEIDGADAWTLFNDTDLGFEVWGTQGSAIELLAFGALETGNQVSLRTVSATNLLAQSFELSSNSEVYEVRLPIYRVGKPTASYWVEIHSSTTGTSDTKDASTNIVGAASDSILYTAIDTDVGWVTFTFSGTKPSLSASTTYYLVLYTNDSVGTTKYIYWNWDTAGYSNGARQHIEETTFVWTAKSDDFSFKIWGAPTAGVKIEEHALADITQVRDLRETTSQQMVVQEFTVDESANCPSIKVYMSKTSSPTGNIWAEIHSTQSGTSASKDSSTYQVGTASDNVAIATTEKAYFTSGGTTAIAVGNVVTGDNSGFTATIAQVILESGAWADGDAAGYLYTTNANGTFTAGEGLEVSSVNRGTITADWAILIDSFPTFNWVTFNFNGTEPNLNSGSTYYLVIYGDYAVSTTAFVNMAVDKVPPGYSDGVRWDINDSEVWSKVTGQDLIFEIYLVTSGLTGTYYYVYTYKRTAWTGLNIEGNPSSSSDSVAPSSQDVNIGVVASTDSQVGMIVLYRTLAGDTSPFYKQGEYANTTATITDSVSDSGLTTLYETDNTVPPKAKFLQLHKDRMYYANCPDEEEGGSLVMWSKSGNGEAVPSTNFQYFDKDDGEEITGTASLGTFFFVFKPNKIGVLDIAAPELWYLGHGIGCIAPWAILTFKDKIIFLSEEGWKATDGTDIWDLSDNIKGLAEDGYLTINQEENYSVAYYPEKEQFQFLINHSSLTPRVIVGHFLVPLILKPTGISELVKHNIIGWTYHQYDYDELTCIGNYTNSDGISKVIAGASDGFVYLLDSGVDDDGNNITTKLRTDWLSLGTPRSISKTIRKGYLTYSTDGTISLAFVVDIDFDATAATSTLTGGDVDLDNSINEDFHLTGTGEVFRFTFTETSSQSLDLMSLVIMYRIEGVR